MILACFISAGQQVVNIKMKSSSKPIILTEINGKKAYFLVDTGSDISVINSSLLKKYDLEEEKIYNNSRRAIGFDGGQSQVMKVKNANVIISEFFTHESFYSMDLDKIATSIEAKTNIRIAGILGADVLLKYNCTIDYNQRQLTMIHHKSNKKLALK